MKTKQFLDLVLGQQGNYCVFAANAAANRRKQKFYDSAADWMVPIDADPDNMGLLRILPN